LTPRSVTRGENPPAGLAVCLDWLAFTFVPVGEEWRGEVAHFLRANFGVTAWEDRGGWQGYECSARVEGALVAWGGVAQRGSVHVELSGSVCGGCDDWPTVVEWLEVMDARLTRVDVAGDDFDSSRLSVAWGIAQHRERGFQVGAQGRPPSARLISDLDGLAGDTLYVGKRENGKLLRLYEKGKQLGDVTSRWCRAEVEWRAKDRVLSFDMLVRPAVYLAGAFPCLAFFSEVVISIRAFRVRAVLSYARMIAIARQHAGRAVNAVLQVTGGNLGECVSLLRRSGLPARINRAEIASLTGT